jgi:hypothetical protein
MKLLGIEAVTISDRGNLDGYLRERVVNPL